MAQVTAPSAQVEKVTSWAEAAVMRLNARHASARVRRLGNSFALLEAHVSIALLARCFSARLVAGHKPQVDIGGTLMIRNGLPMTITPR